MSELLKVGIIGAGGIAHYAHIPGWKNIPEEVELVAICDIIPKRAERASEEFDIPHAYPSAEEMLAHHDLDIVSVCTYNSAHRKCTITALEAGANVLCEKPIAMNSGEAEEMIAAAERTGKTLMVGQNHRFDPESQAAKRFIEDGLLGEVYYGEATNMRRRGIPGWGVFHIKKYSGGGPLIDIGVHSLDLVLWLMGNPEPVAVSGITYQKFGKREDVAVTWGGEWNREEFDVEDMAVGLIRLENGASIVLRVSWAANVENDFHSIRVLGAEGGLKNPPFTLFRELSGKLVDTSPTRLPEVEQSHFEEMKHFAAVVRGEEELIVKPWQSLQVQRILDALYESAEKGEEVRIADCRS
ncbi:MAG: Gfo/Idh/MocA family oxidoreductase [Chloroflexota bacterium]|nr:Gfo/Idh/MocA family oxidoreductase [Chloroflexota bacterium]